MNSKEKYLKLKKGNKNVLDVLNDLKKEYNSIESIAKLREVFPDLSINEAKEILIISETSFNNLDEYQQNLFLNIKMTINYKDNDFLTELYNKIKFHGKTLEKEEIVLLLENINEYNDLFSGSVLCLGKGSNYFKNNPFVIKGLFNYDLDDYDLWSVFLIISYLNLSESFLEELFEYGNYTKFFIGNTVSCFLIVDMLNKLFVKSRNEKIKIYLQNNLINLDINNKSLDIDNLIYPSDKRF